VEESLIKMLAQSGAAFVLLGYVVWQLTAMQRLLIEKNAGMAQQLIEATLALTQANLAATQALRDMEQARAEQRQAHAEQILLTKMTLDKVAESLHG
jgi:hypothetical protein